MLPVVFPGRFVTWGPCCSTFGTLGGDCYDHRLGGGESGTINGSSRTIQNGTPGTRNSSISEDLMKKKGGDGKFSNEGMSGNKKLVLIFKEKRTPLESFEDVRVFFFKFTVFVVQSFCWAFGLFFKTSLKTGLPMDHLSTRQKNCCQSWRVWRSKRF